MGESKILLQLNYQAFDGNITQNDIDGAIGICDEDYGGNPLNLNEDQLKEIFTTDIVISWLKENHSDEQCCAIDEICHMIYSVLKE